MESIARLIDGRADEKPAVKSICGRIARTRVKSYLVGKMKTLMRFMTRVGSRKAGKILRFIGTVVKKLKLMRCGCSALAGEPFLLDLTRIRLSRSKQADNVESIVVQVSSVLEPAGSTALFRSMACTTPLPTKKIAV